MFGMLGVGDNKAHGGFWMTSNNDDVIIRKSQFILKAECSQNIYRYIIYVRNMQISAWNNMRSWVLKNWQRPILKMVDIKCVCMSLLIQCMHIQKDLTASIIIWDFLVDWNKTKCWNTPHVFLSKSNLRFIHSM